MKVKIVSYGGKGYNWANPNEHLEFVGIEVIDSDGVRRYVDESFADGEQPWSENRPSEILPAIKERAKRWLYKGGADEFNATVAWMEERIDAIDIGWLETKAAEKRKRAEELTKAAKAFEQEAEEIRATITNTESDERADASTL